MTAEITFFPVDNGDMTLIKLESGRTILTDVNIRNAADDPDDSTRDVVADLRKRLTRDDQDRLYVDAFLLSHPDKDHCTGLDKHFHLGNPDDYCSKDDKIFIREIWSSPIIFRRASKNHTLCPDAKAFNKEAKRRVARFREPGLYVGEGDRILILGKDENGKTDDLADILIDVDTVIQNINGERDTGFSARLLGPLPKSDDESEEEALAKNRSSVILRFEISASGGTCYFLTAGDAEVAIWERLWERHKYRTDWLEYNLLQAPHHCSWHSLSYDSWSEMGEQAKTSNEARKALSQALTGAHIVASSKPITDDDSDPPCIRAKREYVQILKPVTGKFLCTGEQPSVKRPEPLEFEIGRNGLTKKRLLQAAPAIISGNGIGGQPLPHG